MKKITKTFEMTIRPRDVELDDGGQAKIISIEGDDLDEGMFVRLHSWSRAKVHTDLDQFVKRKVRVTVETID